MSRNPLLVFIAFSSLVYFPVAFVGGLVMTALGY